MKPSVRKYYKYYGLGDLISFRRVTWKRWLRCAARALVKQRLRKPKTRGIAWQRADLLYARKRYYTHGEY